MLFVEAFLLFVEAESLFVKAVWVCQLRQPGATDSSNLMMSDGKNDKKDFEYNADDHEVYHKEDDEDDHEVNHKEDNEDEDKFEDRGDDINDGKDNEGQFRRR